MTRGFRAGTGQGLCPFREFTGRAIDCQFSSVAIELGIPQCYTVCEGVHHGSGGSSWFDRRPDLLLGLRLERAGFSNCRRNLGSCNRGRLSGNLFWVGPKDGRRNTRPNGRQQSAFLASESITKTHSLKVRRREFLGKIKGYVFY